MITKDFAMQLIHDCGYEIKPLQFYQSFEVAGIISTDYLYVGFVDVTIQPGNNSGIATFLLRGNTIREINLNSDLSLGNQSNSVFCIFNNFNVVQSAVNFVGYRMKI